VVKNPPIPLAPSPNRRGIFCNRTLNLRAIRAVGYDMDYTLIHYNVRQWEERAYAYLKQHFLKLGWPIENLEFDPDLVCRGLIIDTEQGNLLKANRFGFIKQALHGTQPLGFEAQREKYSRTIVDLSDRRWVFLNTLFSLSEGCFFAQAIELLDDRKLPEILGYADLYKRVRGALDFAHMEGKLKADILADPERFVDLDPEIPLALLDQKHSGKKLLLITNSEWPYTVAMMSFAFDRYLPKGMTWRDLFDVTIVGARKPDFFSHESPFFEVATEEGLLRPWAGSWKQGSAYMGGSARQVEKHLGLSGDEILYVGDHMFGDVWVSKSVLRWRTALILRELEEEIDHSTAFRDNERELSSLMIEKEKLEAQSCQIRVELQRLRVGYGPKAAESEDALQAKLNELRGKLEALDHRIGPLARASQELANPIWGTLMRAGNDKSHLAFQVERYADIYTSRVSNFLKATPFVYLRSPRGSLPHDPA
jgi:HAD superfamily 5'-nucleotidase-like hydrolase